MKLLSALAVGLMLAGPVSAQDYDKGLAASKAGNPSVALQEWLPLAEQGHREAQFSVGYLYENGYGVLQDYAEAMMWYLLAAKQGKGDAQVRVSVLYYQGKGVLQSHVAAHMWMNIGSAVGGGIMTGEAGKLRDLFAKEMTTDQLVEARLRARVCMESDYQDCG